MRNVRRPTMSDLGLLKERAKYKKLLQEHVALFVFLHLATADYRKSASLSIEKLDLLKKSQLRSLIHNLEGEIADLRQKFGITAPSSWLLKMLDEVDSLPDSECLIPKSVVGQYATNYSIVLPRFDNLPEHARIGFHGGSLRQETGQIQIYLLEAKLYEDMCALFNLSKELAGKVEPHWQGGTKQDMKRCEALWRGTVSNAFYFVESYLNGLAFDFYVLNQTSLDQKTKQLLTEWDDVKQCHRYLSVRDKALIYPRIILNLKHPPLQENNCPELAYLLDQVKLLRDAIAHPSPSITGPQNKEQELYAVHPKHVEAIVDNSIALVRKIEKAIRGNLDQLDWLHNRGSDGLFPESAFK